MPANAQSPRRLFITGASGFVGHAFLAHPGLASFEQVTCLSRSVPPASLPANVQWLRGSVTDASSYSAALAGADCVIHLAAATGKCPRKEYFAVNVEGTRSLIEQCKLAGMKKFLFVSSIAAGFPDQTRYYYAQSKLQAEEIGRAGGLRCAIVRPTMIFGLDSPVFSGLLKLAERNPIPVLGDGRTLVQPIAVSDVADFLLRIVDNDLFHGETFDLGGPDVVSIEELLKKIHHRLRGSEAKTLHIPMPLLLPALTLLEIVAYPVLPITVGQLATFRFDGAVRLDSDLWNERRPHLQTLDQMLATSLP